MGKRINRTIWFLWRMVYPLLLYYFTTLVCTSACGVLFICYGSMQGNPGAYQEMWQEMSRQLVLPVTALSALITALPLGLLYLLFRLEQMSDVSSYNEDEAAVCGIRRIPLRLSPGGMLRLILLGCTACLAGNSLVMSLPFSWDSFQETGELLYTPSFPMQILCIGLIVPFTEELIFRGLGYAKMRRALPMVPCIIINALYFGVYHGNLIQGIYTTLLGVIMALVMEYYDSLLAAYVLHASANVMSILLSSTIIGGLMSVFAVVRWGFILICGGISMFLLYEIRKERMDYEIAFDSNSLL